MLKKHWDEHGQELYDVFADKKTKTGASHYHFDWLPNYIVKKSYPGDNRIAGAKKFAQVINENNLHNLSVPQNILTGPQMEHVMLSQHLLKHAMKR